MGWGRLFGALPYAKERESQTTGDHSLLLLHLSLLLPNTSAFTLTILIWGLIRSQQYVSTSDNGYGLKS